MTRGRRPEQPDDGALLRVREVSVSFPAAVGRVEVISAVSFDLARGATLGIVGESGSGKSVTALAILGLTNAHGGEIDSGSVIFEGRELVGLPQRHLARIRGRRIGMIFQQPIRSLNPAYTVGEQIAESLRRHCRESRRDAWRHAVHLLDRVQIPDAARRAHEYPHTFSGGMCQRVMIAMALSCRPSLLIADEPTTALDVTVQAQILDLLRNLQEETGVAILFISHDLGVIAEMCDSVAVMYAGQVVEMSSAAEALFAEPAHPYTEGLLKAVPQPGGSRALKSIPGMVPTHDALPLGCRFGPRCEWAVAGRCDTGSVGFSVVGERLSRCVRTHELALNGAS